MLRFASWSCGLLVIYSVVFGGNASAAEPLLKLAKGDHVVLVGNTLAERLQQHGHFETFLHSRFPELELVVVLPPKGACDPTTTAS